MASYVPALAALHALADGNKQASAILATLEGGKLVDHSYREACQQLLDIICPTFGAGLDGEQLQANRVHLGWLVSAIAFAVPEGQA